MNDQSKLPCPLAQTDRRLCDGLSLLVEMKTNYFDPDAFRLSLNNTIQTLRNVTFVLQKAKSQFLNFDQWYTGWQEQMRADSLLKWLVDARNIIVKQGDLETQSIARISVVDSWFDPPVFDMAVPPFTPTEEFSELLGENAPEGVARDVGLLRVERRWIHNKLPDHEILESLAHSFGVLSELLLDAHKVLLDQKERDNCPWFTSVKNTKGQLPPCMIAQDWDRTVWLDLHDGSILRPVELQKPTSEEEIRKDASRYPGFIEKQGLLSSCSSLHEESSALFEDAKVILETDGYHNPIALLGYSDGRKHIVGLAMGDQTEKVLMLRKLASEVDKTGAVSVILINEAWISRGPNYPSDGRVANYPNREEALHMIAANESGETIVHTALFIRNAKGKVEFKEEWTSTSDNVNLLQPIREVWNRRKTV